MAHLQHYRSEKPYQRQKSAMQKQLESFLWCSPNKKTLSSASPNDIVSFLIWRDKFGKTKVHRNSCQSKNELGGSILSCSCPKVLAAGTIDNNIGKLRALFKEHGRGVTWNDDLNVGNPAAHRSVKEYHSLVQEEQTIARCFPSQAVPLFLDKLKLLCSHLRNLIVTPEMKSTTRYILARDLAFFSMDCFSGDRGTDLGRVKAMDVLTLHLESGILVNQVFGKTLRGNRARVFGLKPIQGAPYCPIMNLKYYKYSHWGVLAISSNKLRKKFTKIKKRSLGASSPRNSTSNSRSHRNTATDLTLPKKSSANGQKCFSFRGAKLWNSLPAETKQASSINISKHCF